MGRWFRVFGKVPGGYREKVRGMAAARYRAASSMWLPVRWMSRPTPRIVLQLLTDEAKDAAIRSSMIWRRFSGLCGVGSLLREQIPTNGVKPYPSGSREALQLT